jgi:murein DD-endopeptidase MepM/ murein hydrolase activator NlpD
MLVLAALAVAPACAWRTPHPAGEAVHVVESGETVWRIAQRYGVAVDEMIRANAISNVRALAIGTRLRIPGRAAPAPASAAGSGELLRTSFVPPAAAQSPEDAFGSASDEASADELDLAFAWPVHGPLNSAFGERGSRHHSGVDLGVPGGTPVRAVEAGRVVYSERLGAYGNVVIVKHTGDWSSVYAHNARNLVEPGALVEKGAVLAEAGATGNATTDHLHFELRRGQTAVDPLRYLP